jgi:hypothetical protein
MEQTDGETQQSDVPLGDQLRAIGYHLKRCAQDWGADVKKFGTPTQEIQREAGEALQEASRLIGLMVLEAGRILAVEPGHSRKHDHSALRSTSSAGFPRVWQLFLFLLPPSVRERVYEPAHEELKEDYIRARAICAGRCSRAWVAFCFTMRTGGLFAGSLWAVAGGTVRKVAFAAVALLFGEHAVTAVRAKIAEWWGRLL